jgi:hypothetical protein
MFRKNISDELPPDRLPIPHADNVHNDGYDDDYDDDERDDGSLQVVFSNISSSHDFLKLLLTSLVIECTTPFP